MARFRLLSRKRTLCLILCVASLLLMNMLLHAHASGWYGSLIGWGWFRWNDRNLYSHQGWGDYELIVARSLAREFSSVGLVSPPITQMPSVIELSFYGVAHLAPVWWWQFSDSFPWLPFCRIGYWCDESECGIVRRLPRGSVLFDGSGTKNGVLGHDHLCTELDLRCFQVTIAAASTYMRTVPVRSSTQLEVVLKTNGHRLVPLEHAGRAGRFVLELRSLARNSSSFKKTELLHKWRASRTSYVGLVSRSYPLREEFRSIFASVTNYTIEYYQGGSHRLDEGLFDEVVNHFGGFRFSMVFENSNSRDGYISEKLVNGFLGGTIPIYSGPKDVGKFFNKAAFIDIRDFGSLEEVAAHVQRVDQDPELALQYLLQPACTEANAKHLFWWRHLNASRP